VVFEKSQQDPKLEGMGTTLTAAWVEEGTVRLAHVGDSRAYLLRRGSLQQLTEDHTVVQRWVNEGRLPQDEAGTHPYRNLLQQALGAQPELEVEVLSVELEPGDRLLLASDGLHHQPGMTDERIAEILATAPDASEACRVLVDEANAAGGDDNITVLLVDAEREEGSPADETDRPVIVSRPAPAVRRTKPAASSWAKRGVWLAVIGLVVIVSGLVLWASSGKHYVVADNAGQVAILRGRAGQGTAPAKGEVVRRTDIPVSSLPSTFQRRLRSGIEVSSLAAAERTITDLPRTLGPTQTPSPEPSTPPPAPPPASP
jgi:protein phosphatase